MDDLLRPPNGALFKAVVAQTLDGLYEVPLTILPKPTRDLLDTVERTEWPALYRTRIHGVLGQAGMMDGSHVISPTATDNRVRLKLNVAEVGTSDRECYSPSESEYF